MHIILENLFFNHFNKSRNEYLKYFIYKETKNSFQILMLHNHATTQYMKTLENFTYPQARPRSNTNSIQFHQI